MNSMSNLKVLVTGANGFIGKNLCVRLQEAGVSEVYKYVKGTSDLQLEEFVNSADFIFHLAGVNRPKDNSEFKTGNVDLTKKIVDLLLSANKKTPIVFASSIQAELDNFYGLSKAEGERHIIDFASRFDSFYYIYRLPNVFGKWCKPNYNSFVATFCYNIANDLPVSINDPLTKVSLTYIDDVCDDFINTLQLKSFSGYKKIESVYNVTVGDVAELITSFKESRKTLITLPVGEGFTRALYSTWLSYLNPDEFIYDIPSYVDPRGVFCEMLKTKDSGQFSFFTAHPGITRGGHYHHSKTEKFLVIKGKASFKFQNIITNDSFSITTSDENYQVVETIPGWNHDITNVGDNELIVMLWANEIFDRNKPDTFARDFE